MGFANLDLMLNFDFQKILGWKGSSFYLHHHTHSGTNPTDEYIGDQNWVNSFSPVDHGDSFISQAYLKQTFAEESGNFLLGLYDFSSEFFMTKSSLIFLNGAFLLGLESYLPEPADLSIYPVNAPALRVRWGQENSFYAMAGVSSALPRDRSYTKGTHPRWGETEGSYQVIEAGLLKEIEKDVVSKYALGVWSVSKNTVKHGGTEDQTAMPWGAYLLFDQPFDAKKSLFYRVGIANGAVSSVDQSHGLGIRYNGLFSEKDSLGLGYSVASLSSDYLKVNDPAGTNFVKSESVIELVYRLELKPGVVLSPDFQKVFNPSMNKDISEATVGSVRFEFAF